MCLFLASICHLLLEQEFKKPYNTVAKCGTSFAHVESYVIKKTIEAPQDNVILFIRQNLLSYEKMFST